MRHKPRERYGSRSNDPDAAGARRGKNPRRPGRPYRSHQRERD